MKKVLVIVACIFMTTYGFAQDLKFGVKAGLNLSTVVGDDVEDTDMTAGLYFGGFLNVPLSDRLSFQPELLYSRQGWKSDWKFEGDSFKNTLKLSYLNIPMLLKMSLGASDKIHVYAGPQLGFLLDAELDYEGNGGSGTGDYEDYMNDIDFSIILGLSFNVSDNMSLDVRYNRGLSNIYNYEDGDYKAYSSVFQLGASYSF